MPHKVEVTDEMDETFLDTVSNGQKSSTWITRVQVNGKSIPFKMDTGAEVTAISEETHKLLKKPRLTTAKMSSMVPLAHS